jgi:hypothetical protein
MIKYEAKYVYSYVIDNDAPGLKNTDEFLPFLYDRREQTESRQYIECSSCGTLFPCFIPQGSRELDFKLLKSALRQENITASNVKNNQDVH